MKTKTKSSYLIKLMLLTCLISNSQVLTFNYSKVFNSSQLINIIDMKVDSVNNFIYVTGDFYGLTDFDFSSTTYTLNPIVPGTPSIYFAKYTLNGTLLWAKAIGNNYTNYINKINFDSNNNVYLAGRFLNVLDFDPSSITYTLNAPNTSATGDGFFAKYNQNGNFIFAKSISGADWQNISDIEINAANEIYVSGTYQGITDFDPTTTTYSVNTSGSSFDRWGFINKYDITGNLIFVKSFTASTSGASCSFSDILLTSNSIYATGSFDGTFDFDPNILTYTLSSNSVSGIILKLDNLGNFIFSKQLSPNLSGDCFAKKIQVLNQKIYVCGNFRGTIDFDASSSTSNLFAGNLATFDIFATCYSNTGSFIWAKGIGNIGSSELCEDISVSKNGNILLTGSFESAIDFDPGPATFTLSPIGGSLNDSYISALDTNGAFKFAYNIGSTNNDAGYNIGIKGNSIFNSGSIRGSADFDFSTNTFILAPASINATGYLARYEITSAPNASFTASQINFCQNSCINFIDNSTNIPTTWLWTFTGSSGTTTSSIQNPTGICYNNPGTYTVSLLVTNLAGTSLTNNTINVVPQPTVSITAINNPICNGETSTLTANGAISYTWTSLTTNSFITVTPNVSTSYTVIGTNGNGCSVSAIKTITVNALPIVNLSVANSSVCLNSSNIILTGSPSGGSYSGVNVSSNVFIPSNIGVFAPAYSYTNSLTGCHNTSTISIIVNSCTTLKKLSSSQTKLITYPNPNNGLLYIEYVSGKLKCIEISDLHGKKIYSTITDKDSFTINISNFSNGIYNLNIIDDEINENFKIVKQD